MRVDLPELLASELAKIASARGESLDSVVTGVLREQLSELRASADQDVSASPPVVTTGSRRETLELAALHARAAVLLGRQNIAGWTNEEHRKVAALSSGHFVTDGARGRANAIDLASKENLPFNAKLPPLTDAPSATDVLSALKSCDVRLVVRFRTYGRVPMRESLACKPLPGTLTLTLISGVNSIHEDAYSTELIAIEIEVPISDYGRRTSGLPHNDDRALDTSTEFDTARLALEHVINVLRIMKVKVVHSDHRASHGVPHQSWVVLAFGDGTVQRTENTTYGWIGSGSLLSPSVIAHPLQVPADLFAETYRAASHEVALLGGSTFHRAADYLRHLLLIVESTHPRPTGPKPSGMCKLEAALHEQPFQSRLERLVADKDPSTAAFPNHGALATELADLRNLISHLRQRQHLGSAINRLAQPYGFSPHDVTLLQRIHKATPVAAALAKQIVSDIVRPHQLSPARERRAGVKELVELRQTQGYVVGPAAEILERETLIRWHDDGDRDPAMADLVIELFGTPATEHLARSFIQVAIALPQTHGELYAAIQRNTDDFAEHATRVIAIESPSLLEGLRGELVLVQRDELLAMLDRVSEEERNHLSRK